MTLADLLTTLETRAALPASRAKDCKTSLRYLAAAIGRPTLETCLVDATCRDPAAWTAALDTHFATLTAQGRTISATTRRNTRNNLRVVFRLAETHGLLTDPLPPRLLRKPKRVAFELQQAATTPYASTYKIQRGPRRFGLPQRAWPEDILAGWHDYQVRCGLRIRPTTFRTHAKSLATYLGYLAHICGRTPTWDHLFELAPLSEFLHWHGARMGRPITIHGRSVVIVLAAMAVVLEHPARRALADFRNALPTPAPMHSKRAHWVSLATLEAVADACLTEGRVPYIFRQKDRLPGVRRATQFQLGLMLKLLVRVPLRQRNVRELRLGENLYKDGAGHWQLTFGGSDLKVGTRRGMTNAYHLDLSAYSPNFIPTLEEWLQVYRPRLPNHATLDHLFLTYRGNPFTQRSLHGELSSIVSRHTGQRFYPHLIRTIWATEYLEKTQDFTTAATMLGDTLGVVMRTYYDIVHKDQHAKASAFLSTALGGG